MKTLYFDCFAGASGNMILGALIGAGVDADLLTAELKKLKIADFEINIETVDRSGISATHVTVEVPDEKAHRHLHQIEGIIHGCDLSETVKNRAISIFRRLAEAEAKVHGIDVAKVHFHEVGAMDAIVDIVGACIGFEMLGIERFVCSKIHVGNGFVDMEHGKFPVPPPAVAELLKGIPMYSTEVAGELITPTGAAIISTVCDSYTTIPEISVEVTVYGAGAREYDRFPNALRILVGETSRSEPPALADGLNNSIMDVAEISEVPRNRLISNNELVLLLETNIDDMSPQIVGFVMERAFDLGALDCWFTPIQMKKNRPAVMLSVLCEHTSKDGLIDMIYAETSTLGIRIREIERQCLEREIVTVSTEYGDVAVKIARSGGKVVNVMPEYEDVRRLALENRVAFRIVRDAALLNLKAASKAAGN